MNGVNKRNTVFLKHSQFIPDVFWSLTMKWKKEKVKKVKVKGVGRGENNHC